MPPILPTNDGIVNERDDGVEEQQSYVFYSTLEDDADIVAQEGYQILSPNGDYPVWGGDDDDSEEESIDIDPNEVHMTAVCQTQPVEAQTPAFDVEMNSEHIETIKSVMKNVTLPDCNLPAWINTVSEEEWKALLLQKISTSTCSSVKSDDDKDLNIPSTSTALSNKSK